MESSYVSKSDSAFKWCYRRKLGVYPKSWLSPIKKVLRFIVKTLLRHKIEFTARGRGSRAKVARSLGKSVRMFNQDLPVKYAKRVAIYVSIYRRR
jgi:hypothetical protein